MPVLKVTRTDCKMQDMLLQLRMQPGSSLSPVHWNRGKTIIMRLKCRMCSKICFMLSM